MDTRNLVMRGWDKKLGEWCDEIRVCVGRASGFVTIDGRHYHRSEPWRPEIDVRGDDIAVVRFTGTHDTADVPIHEYDIVVVSGEVNGCMGEPDVVNLVRFHHGSFVLEYPGYDDLTPLPDGSLMLVVGNIFENPSAWPEPVEL